MQTMKGESADLLFSQGPGSINCNWTDLELLSISLLLLKAQQVYSVDTDDQNTSRGQQEVLLYSSLEKKHNMPFWAQGRKSSSLKKRKFSLTFCLPSCTFPLLSSFLSLTLATHLCPEGQYNFMADTDFSNSSNFNPVKSIPKAQKVSN